MSKEKRTNFILMMIGHNRTGKSVYALEIAKSYKKSHKKKKVISFDPQSRFSDVTDRKIYSEDWEQFFSEDGQKLEVSDTLFILDDYRGLMPKDTLDPNFLRMIMQRNEYGLDFIFICHSPKLILERLSYYITHFALFYTSGDVEGFKGSKKMMNIETIVQCREYINRYVKDNSRGVWSKDGKHTFPFLFIDTEDEKINLINMPDATVSGKTISYKSKPVEKLEQSTNV